jgi:uncharacterized membrane protein
VGNVRAPGAIRDCPGWAALPRPPGDLPDLQGPFTLVRGHSLESRSFQLTLLIGYIISAVLFFVLVGFFTAAIIAIASIVLQILAAVAANRGEEYRYPLTIRFVH